MGHGLVINTTEIGKQKEQLNMTLQIKIKYSDDTQTRISKIEQGDWIDLRATEDITIKKVNSNLSRLSCDGTAGRI